MKHKHADVLIAIAEGKVVQCRDEYSDWRDVNLSVVENSTDPFTFPDLYWRIKPEPKPDLVLYGLTHWIRAKGRENQCEGDSCKFTFDGETGKLKKAEVL